MKVTFREYSHKDYDLFLDLSNKLEEYAKDLDPIKRVKNSPGFIELSVQETLDKVAKNNGKIWLLEDQGKVSGYIVGVIWEQSEKNKLEIGPHKLGEVIDIYLEEEARKQGVGTKMLQLMEDYFKQNGCDSMWVNVFAPNENAHNFYKKLGFTDREVGLLKTIL